MILTPGKLYKILKKTYLTQGKGCIFFRDMQAGEIIFLINVEYSQSKIRNMPNIYKILTNDGIIGIAHTFPHTSSPEQVFQALE